MSGLHFGCGKWGGEDNTANPIFEIFDEIEEVIGIADESWFIDFRDAVDTESERLVLDAKALAAIEGPMTEYKAMLLKDSGATDEDLANYKIPDSVSDEMADRLLCVGDFFLGLARAKQTSEPLEVYFA